VLKLEADHLKELFLWKVLESTLASAWIKSVHEVKRKRFMNLNRNQLTGFDDGIDQLSILLPLHSHSPWIFPITRMRFIYFMKSPQPKSCSGVGNVLAERPPETFSALNAALSRSIWAFGVKINRVDACPPS